MLAHEFSDRSKLLTFIKARVTEHCHLHNLPQLPVRYGTVGSGAKMSWVNLPPRIHVWEGLASWLSAVNENNRVWYVIQAIHHELRHYEIYLGILRRGIIPNQELMILSEDESYLSGFEAANEKLSVMSPEEINPFAGRNLMVDTKRTKAEEKRMMDEIIRKVVAATLKPMPPVSEEQVRQWKEEDRQRDLAMRYRPLTDKDRQEYWGKYHEILD